MSSVGEVVQQKKLQLAKQIKSLQKQADTLRAMDEMNDTELQLELFDLLDMDSDGLIPLQDIVEWVSVSEQLLSSITPADLEAAAKGSSRVDRTEFGHFLAALVKKAGGSFKDWAELLVLSHRVPSTRPESAGGGNAAEARLQDLSPAGRPGAGNQGATVGEGTLEAAKKDGRMQALFALFDMDLDGRVGFKDVAVGLHKIAPHVPLQQASQTAVKVLLTYDRDQDRTLDYNEFAHFICAFLHAAGLSFSQVAGALVYAAARPDPTEQEQQELDTLASVPPEDYATFADWRAHRIFDLLDRDHDDRISFKELVLGLHRFEPAAPLQQTAQEAAALLEEAHMGGDQAGSLDRVKFVQLLDRFTASSGASFDQVADYLVALSAQDPIATSVEEGGQEDGASLPAWWFQRFLWDTPMEEPKIEVS